MTWKVTLSERKLQRQRREDLFVGIGWNLLRQHPKWCAAQARHESEVLMRGKTNTECAAILKELRQNGSK